MVCEEAAHECAFFLVRFGEHQCVCVRVSACLCFTRFYSCVRKRLEVNKHIMNTRVVNCLKRGPSLAGRYCSYKHVRGSGCCTDGTEQRTGQRSYPPATARVTLLNTSPHLGKRQSEGVTEIIFHRCVSSLGTSAAAILLCSNILLLALQSALR